MTKKPHEGTQLFCSRFWQELDVNGSQRGSMALALQCDLHSSPQQEQTAGS